MNPEQLANVILTIVKAQPLTDQQKFELVGRLAQGVLSDSPIQVTVSTPVPNVAQEPPLVFNKGPLMIPKGTVCKCELCKAVAYKVIKDVYENSKTADFMASFTPPLTKDHDLWGDPDGNVAVDCPLCKGVKTVWIKGKGDKLFGDFPSEERPLNAS